MSIRWIALSLTVACLSIGSGCGGNITGPGGESAVIVGNVVPGSAAGKYATAAQLSCPDIVVSLNDEAVNIELDEDCSFLIDDVRPSARVVLFIQIPELGVSGTIELEDVGAAELIEILVEADDESLTISVLRRARPGPADELPLLIAANNVTVFIPAGIYDQSLTVEGNNFTLVGEAGVSCDASGWSIITGEVIIVGNNATFRNIRFEGPVKILGNNTKFINTCLGSKLVIFGNNTEFEDDEDDDEGDGDDDDDGGDDD